ncbi:hypothetical protein RRG08_002981 [Elysia crispata]|uniref:G-protein coupled receptors family 1 profile domain-containing protein n=1 Tax=Elysia crispata TaxID=231223 RepID=A0AAE0XQE7_9GAST|nr:hypothetical protein RRG08_002981 [Elysia crispata]
MEIVNTIVFFKMGLRDGVNQNFFILSVSDALQGVIGLADSIIFIFELTSFQFETVSNFALHALCGITYAFLLSVSIITTTVIAVVRCCCVTMPLNVYTSLNARRQLTIILIFCGASSAVQIFISSNIELYSKIESSNNTEQKLLLSASTFKLWGGANVSLFVSCFTIILTSMLILIGTLRKYSRLHREAADSVSFYLNEIRSARDVRVIKRIFLILAIFIACNFLVVFIAILRLISPEFGPLADRRHEFFYLDLLRRLCLDVNISVNIFVYYVNHAKFRKEVKSLLKGMYR